MMSTDYQTKIEPMIMKDIKNLKDDIQFVAFIETEDFEYQDMMVMLDDLTEITYYIKVDEAGVMNDYLDEIGVPVKVLRNFSFY